MIHSNTGALTDINSQGIKAPAYSNVSLLTPNVALQ